jgi:CDP-diacylglycerol---glycerol-3-phosphate 3-phosphatidyltransferase
LKKLINLPNFISFFRVVLTLLGLLVFFITPNKVLFFSTTVLVIALDGLDGIVARWLKESSELGAKIDIYADRFIELAYWLFFSLIELIPFWIFCFFLVRGLLVDYLSYKNQETLGQSFLRSSRFMRAIYGFLKLSSFSLLILVPDFDFFELNLALLCSYLTVLVCGLRALPVFYKNSLFKRPRAGCFLL